MLDALLRAFVERWLQDLLGAPSRRPEAFVKVLTCGCADCEGVNMFLRSDATTETIWAPQKRRSHVERSIGGSIPSEVTLTTIMRGSPYGLQITKTKGALTTGWDGRVAIARNFLSVVGTGVVARIMGDRYQDVHAALAGTKPYKISEAAPAVALAQGAPVASTSAARANYNTGPVVAGMKRKAAD